MIASVLSSMLERYSDETAETRLNAVHEIIQEATLYALSRAGFFQHAAFYGGTALRIFHGLDRFSEDLDFSLMKHEPDFNLQDFFPVLERELQAFGLRLEVSSKEKNRESAIRSAFLKGNTIEHILLFYPQIEKISGIAPSNWIKVKFEVDTNPPEGASFEQKYALEPYPYAITLYDPASLFAGKLHAVLCRNWKQRIKGRDFYDFLFYIRKGIPFNLRHLQARLIQTDPAMFGEMSLNLDTVKLLLKRRFDETDFYAAKLDVMPFVRDSRVLDLWSTEFFTQISDRLSAV